MSLEYALSFCRFLKKNIRKLLKIIKLLIESDLQVIRRPEGTRGSASEKQYQMGKKEGATTEEQRKPRAGGLKVAIWSYFLVNSESRLSKELVRPSFAWCLELASSRLKEGATTDDKRKQRSGSLKAAKLVSVRKQRWAGAIASRRPRRPLVSWCDSAARPRFWRLASWKLKLEILVASKSDVRHWQPFVLVFHCVSVLRGQGFGGLQVGN